MLKSLVVIMDFVTVFGDYRSAGVQAYVNAAVVGSVPTPSELLFIIFYVFALVPRQNAALSSAPQRNASKIHRTVEKGVL